MLNPRCVNLNYAHFDAPWKYCYDCWRNDRDTHTNASNPPITIREGDT